MPSLVSMVSATITIGASSTISIPAMPAHRWRDRAVLRITGKYDTATVLAAVDPSWVLVGEGTGGTGVAGADTGITRWMVFMHDCLTDDDPAPQFTSGATGFNVAAYNLLIWRPTSGTTWRDAITTSAPYVVGISDTNTASPLSGTADFTTVQPTTGDIVFMSAVVPSDVGSAVATFTATATGLTGGTIDTGGLLTYGETTAGDDLATAERYWTGFTGTASAPVSISITITSLTNHSGSIVAIAMRERTPTSAPDVPDNVDVEVGIRALGYTWDPPAAGDFAESYEVRIDGGSIFDPDPVITHYQPHYNYDIAPLLPATGYTFEVRSKNVAGTSSWVTLTPTTLSDPADYGVRPWDYTGDLVPQEASVWLDMAGLTGQAYLTFSGTAGVSAGAAGTGSLSFSGTGGGRAVLTGTASIALSGTGTPRARMVATASITLSATGNPSARAVATGSLTLSGTGVFGAGKTGTGSLTLTGTGFASVPAVATGAGALVLTGTMLARATVTGTGTLVLTAIDIGYPVGASGSLALHGIAIPGGVVARSRVGRRASAFVGG